MWSAISRTTDLSPSLPYATGVSVVPNTAPPLFSGHEQAEETLPSRGEEAGGPAAKHRAASPCGGTALSTGATAHLSTGKMQLTGESPIEGKGHAILVCSRHGSLRPEHTEEEKKKDNRDTGATTMMGWEGAATERSALSPSSDAALRTKNAREAQREARSTRHSGKKSGAEMRRWTKVAPRARCSESVAPPTLEWRSISENTAQHTRRQARPSAQEEAACWCSLEAKRAWKSCVSSNTSTLSCSLGRSSSSVSNLKGSSATGSSPGS